MPSILILGQFHAADSREHMRVHRPIADCFRDLHGVRFFANGRRLILLPIAADPLNHPL